MAEVFFLFLFSFPFFKFIGVTTVSQVTWVLGVHSVIHHLHLTLCAHRPESAFLMAEVFRVWMDQFVYP